MDYDDWLFDSIKKYKNLSMYDIQQTITAVDWVNGKSLLVATSSGQKYELVELLLPDKILDTGSNGKLKKDRDFRIHTGGFCTHQIDEVKHIPNTRHCVIAESSRPGVTIWEMGNDNTDLMREHTSIGTVLHGDRTRISIAAGRDNVVFGSQLNDIQVLDGIQYEKIMDTSACKKSDKLTALHHQNSEPDILLCCTNFGDLYLLDLRCRKVNVTCQRNCGKSASFWTMSKPIDQSNCLLQLSSEGQVVQTDVRCMEECVWTKDTGLSTDSNFEYLKIEMCPKGDQFSLSGFDGLVHVYQHPENSNTNQSESTTLKPVFSHEGHVMNTDSQSDCLQVVKHLWHPWQQDLIISCGTDASLHAWQYSDTS